MRAFMFAFQLVAHGLTLTNANYPITLMGIMNQDYYTFINATAELAVGDINHDTSLLQNYTLSINLSNGHCLGGSSMYAMFQQLNSPPIKYGVIGGICAPESKALASVAQYFNLLQMAPLQATPDGSERLQYPTMIGLYPPSWHANKAMAAILKLYKWNRIAIVREDADTYITSTADLLSQLTNYNVSSIALEVVSNTDKIYQVVDNLRARNARVIVVTTYSSTAKPFFCAARKAGMYGPKYVYFVKGEWPDLWCNTSSPRDLPHNCTMEELSVFCDCSYVFGSVYFADMNSKTTSGKTPAELKQRLVIPGTSGELPLGWQYSGYLYDSIYALALALHHLDTLMTANLNKTLLDFKYDDSLITPLLSVAVKMVRFMGFTGIIDLESGTSNKFVTEIMQVVNGQRVRLGVFDHGKNALQWDTGYNGLIFARGIIPADGPVIQTVWQLSSVSITGVSCFLAVIGLLLSTIFITFNCKHSGHPLIKMASPRLNAINGLGCGICSLFILINALEERTGDSTNHLILCILSYWLLPIGFTLAFGALFMKALRISLVINVDAPQFRVIKDHQLMYIILASVGVDVMVMALWHSLGQIEIFTVCSVPSMVSHMTDEITQSCRLSCGSKNPTPFLVVLLIWKGFIIAFGLYMAWKTRTVKIDNLNESRLIGLCIYSTALTCVVGVPVLVAMSQSDNNDVFNLLFNLLVIVGVLVMLLAQQISLISKMNNVQNNVTNLQQFPKSKSTASRGKSLASMSKQNFVGSVTNA